MRADRRERVKTAVVRRYGQATVEVRLEDTGEAPTPDVWERMQHESAEDFRTRRLREREGRES